MIAKFMEIAFLTKVDKTNINATGVEGDITLLKKTEGFDGKQYPYVSGQSVKFAIKQYLLDAGWSLSPIKPKEEEAQITTECNPVKYIDDDLFGYMDTAKDVRRTAPVKTNGMISIFEWKGDLDRGVRYDPEGKRHSLFDIEITTTIFRSNWAIELDLVGRAVKKDEIKGVDGLQDGYIGDFINNQEKEKRIKALLDALFNFWTRVKQTNFFTKTSPEVMFVILRDDKSATIGDKLRVDKNLKLDVKSLREATLLARDKIKKAYFGYNQSFLTNTEDELNQLEIDGVIKIMLLHELKNFLLSGDFKIYE
ncbi:MAG: type I-B CRISPR-associated protein Cas7/Cst2/DevR [Nitrososphaerota archaeon]|uniref:type I-B CRISPR-associated protein Cas7/Cst2/DevR n=1 Tax=Saccharolobus sp. TaxID=2100761 RepID=UPI00317C93E5